MRKNKDMSAYASRRRHSYITNIFKYGKRGIHFQILAGSGDEVNQRLEQNLADIGIMREPFDMETYDREFAGRNRRYYKVTEKGMVQLNLYREEWKSYSTKISALFEGGD